MTNKLLNAGAICVVFGTMYVGSHAASARDDFYEDQVRDQIRQAALTVFKRDDMTHRPYFGKLLAGHSDTLTLQLRKGLDYAILGVCDEDCQDMDLKLYDENGNLIGTDEKPDSIPVVYVTPIWTGAFRLKVDIPDCRANRCTYGIAIFGE